jgi:hypothetical protein
MSTKGQKELHFCRFCPDMIKILSHWWNRNTNICAFVERGKKRIKSHDFEPGALHAQASEWFCMSAVIHLHDVGTLGLSYTHHKKPLWSISKRSARNDVQRIAHRASRIMMRQHPTKFPSQLWGGGSTQIFGQKSWTDKDREVSKAVLPRKRQVWGLLQSWRLKYANCRFVYLFVAIPSWKSCIMKVEIRVYIVTIHQHKTLMVCTRLSTSWLILYISSLRLRAEIHKRTYSPLPREG